MHSTCTRYRSSFRTYVCTYIWSEQNKVGCERFVRMKDTSTEPASSHTGLKMSFSECKSCVRLFRAYTHGVFQTCLFCTSSLRSPTSELTDESQRLGSETFRYLFNALRFVKTTPIIFAALQPYIHRTFRVNQRNPTLSLTFDTTDKQLPFYSLRADEKSL